MQVLKFLNPCLVGLQYFILEAPRMMLGNIFARTKPMFKSRGIQVLEFTLPEF
jgi:hypothetical protein